MKKTMREWATGYGWEKLDNEMRSDMLAADSEIETLRKRLADCVAWMDTREKKVPGLPRVCDMARDLLDTKNKETDTCNN